LIFRIFLLEVARLFFGNVRVEASPFTWSSKNLIAKRTEKPRISWPVQRRESLTKSLRQRLSVFDTLTGRQDVLSEPVQADRGDLLQSGQCNLPPSTVVIHQREAMGRNVYPKFNMCADLIGVNRREVRQRLTLVVSPRSGE
jgi:hypothetical protein